MMIAIITIKSGLEGLCTHILQFRFAIISGLRSLAHLLLFLVERKNILKKKQSVQDLIPPPCIVGIYEYMYTEM